MTTFNVALTRKYLVEIEAKDEEQAKFLTEYFISYPSYASTEKERAGYGFCF